MSESKQKWTPGPWETNQCGDLIGGNGEKVFFAGDGFAIACGRRNEEWNANGRVAKAAPELVEALKKIVDSAEQHAFEYWLASESPSGCVEQVQDQWEKSSEYEQFCCDWETELAALAKAGA
ncbi:hypothetical protein [Burkholderia glumae]|uniref:hypothetical protein n=1 Tax=Burkholderia glumae TaxID=337 RepID=UPI002151BEC0|nr:hypothetical protein [Burkholderia glumae]